MAFRLLRSDVMSVWVWPPAQAWSGIARVARQAWRTWGWDCIRHPL